MIISLITFAIAAPQRFFPAFPVPRHYKWNIPEQLIARAKVVPDRKEIEPLLRSAWVKYGPDFGLGSSIYSKLNDAECQEDDLIFACNLNVAARLKGKRQQAQQKMHFRRVLVKDKLRLIIVSDMIYVIN